MTTARLLATDLDRTLLPNGTAPESKHARTRFARFVEERGLTLAFVTGRRRELVRDAITEWSLPEPDFVVADVGSSVYQRRDGEWKRDPAWDALLAEDWGGWNGAEVMALFGDDPRLVAQEPGAQGCFKASFTCEPELDEARLREELGARLASEGLPSRIVFSVDEVHGIGLVDALPAASGKLAALDHVRRACGASATDTLFAGDSGNDLEVLVGPLPAVLVANADPDLRARIVREAEARGNADTLYLARGETRGGNGNYAAGILEGWAHFHPEDRAYLEELAG